jgi:hypothetical protein
MISFIKNQENCDHPNAIVTTYFSSRFDPQPNAQGEYNIAPKNNINYIYPWFASVSYLKLNAIVIHDELNDEFIQKYENEHIKFYKYIPKKYSLNDERYYAFRNLLREVKFNKVFFTDGSDVIIKRDPFEFIADDVLYFGEDQGETPKIMNNNWCISKLSQLLQNNKFKNELNDDFLNFEYVNNGVMGGYHDSLSYFLEQVCTVFDQLECGNNNNMMVTNYLLWKNKIQYFKGAPLTSPFKKYQMHGDYYFIHK